MTYSDHRNSRRVTVKGAAHHPGMCLAAAILFKEEMVGVQSLLSLVLFNAKNVSFQQLLMYSTYTLY